MLITEEIKIDVSREYGGRLLMAKQYDQNSRILRIRLTNGGEPINVDHTEYAIFKAQRIDGEHRTYEATVNEDGTISVTLTEWALEIGHNIRCEIIVVDANAKRKLTSARFVIFVEASISPDEEMAEDEKYNFLINLISNYDTAIEETKNAVEAVNGAVAAALKWEHINPYIEMLDSTAQPSVTVVDSKDCIGKDLKIKIPRGEKGDTGPAGAVQSVNGVLPDESGNVTLPEVIVASKIIDRIYDGTDLTAKFASEIAAYPYNGNPWAWIKARIQAGNFDGIHVCDYIPFTTVNNVKMQAQVAGINTYKDYGDTVVGNHIDFITRENWPTFHPMNKVNYNNGVASQPSPWLASDGYHWLNSLAGQVPKNAVVNPEMTEVNYTSDGVYHFLPDALKAAIIEKRMLVETRYSSSGLLTESNGWAWANVGKLWLPTETEIYGVPCWGGYRYAQGGSIQYPIFSCNTNRLKYRNEISDTWWNSTPRFGDSIYWCTVSNYGAANAYAANNIVPGMPICFRVGA